MAKRTDIQKILIIGSGPIIIGQACEFDYSGTQACKALRALGYTVILANSNPATIMTDPQMADKTYIEPLTIDRIEKIIAKERPDALLPNLGGQTALNLACSLHDEGILEKYNVQVIGVVAVRFYHGVDLFEGGIIHINALICLGRMAHNRLARQIDVVLFRSFGHPCAQTVNTTGHPAHKRRKIGGLIDRCRCAFAARQCVIFG